MKKLSILYINSQASGGGAALAARRLREAFANLALTKLLVAYTPQVGKDITGFRSGKIGKWLFWFHFAIERLYFVLFEKDKSVRFTYSPANIGVNLQAHSWSKEADIIHLHWINQGFINMNSLKPFIGRKKPLVWTLHDMWLFTGGCHHDRGCDHYLKECGTCHYLKTPSKNDISHKLWSQKNEVLTQLPLTIVTPSNWLADRARESSLLRNIKVEVIGNALNTDKFKPADKLEARQLLGLKSDKIYISFIAANVSNPYKGAAYLKEAFAWLKENHPLELEKIELIVIGDDKTGFFNDFPSSCFRAGYISDENKVISYYQASSLFLLPSLEENLPNTIVEAMSCGVPCVSFDVGGISDLIKHQKTGYLAKYRNAVDLASGILWCIENEERSLSLAKESREHMLANYSYPVIAEKHQQLYTKLLS